MNPSTHAARVLLQALAAAGVRHVVLSPGSRSAPLAHAVAQAALPDGERPANAPALDLHVRVDERAAGFLAVGLARATALNGSVAPVAVVTTSGTAVANLHPAVLEAHHAGLPLLLLTADRPHELRGTGANQTTDQVGLFAGAVRLVLDLSAPVGGRREMEHLRRVAAEAVATASGVRSGDPGPVHVNLGYREPLEPDDAAWPRLPLPTRVPRAREVPLVAVLARTPDNPPPPRGWTQDEPTVVVAGDGAGAAAGQIAEANGWPLLAEPSSGARGGPNAVPAYRLVLARLGAEVRRVVVLGRPTLSRPVLSLLARRDVRTLAVVHRGSASPDAGRWATGVLTEVPAWLRTGGPDRVGDPAWLERWLDEGRSALDAVRGELDVIDADQDVIDADQDVHQDDQAATWTMSGPALAVEVAAASGADDVLVVGASNPIRDLDLVADWVTPPLVVANRGLSGIDGTTSTAAGLALGLDRPVRAYLGDLTFLHDVGGLLVGSLERRPDLQLVVANDDGGSVFATLEHGDPAHAGVFERVFGTPHGIDLAALCAGYGVPCTRVEDLGALRAVLAEPVRGLSVVEVPVDRAGRRELQERVSAVVADAGVTDTSGE
jgi:2-succinyl-5-enolpyruvyl-6-hydroxy-3-cyclohexene-1-carboxylate synthase